LLSSSDRSTVSSMDHLSTPVSMMPHYSDAAKAISFASFPIQFSVGMARKSSDFPPAGQRETMMGEWKLQRLHEGCLREKGAPIFVEAGGCAVRCRLHQLQLACHRSE
jgi:hypothetical protein